MYKTIFTYFCSFIKIDKSLIVSFPFNIVQESLKTKLEEFQQKFSLDPRKNINYELLQVP